MCYAIRVLCSPVGGGNAGDRAPGLAGEAGERGRIGDRRAELVVVEVRVDGGVIWPGLGQPPNPAPERLSAITRPRLGGSLVKPDIPPAGRPPQRSNRSAELIRPAQCGVV